MTARMRRVESDYRQIKKDFAGHKYIIVTPVGSEPPEKYNVTYFVNGIYLLPDGKIETLGRHEVEIILHAEYPRYKPICKINTPIWHPNFRDGQICIGDIWGAGESLSDIIINIGDMIQYKSWNSYSPLSAEAAKWAIENKHLFPIGTLDLYKADYSAVKISEVEIDLLDDSDDIDMNNSTAVLAKQPAVTPPSSSSSGYPLSGLDADTTVVEEAAAMDVLDSQVSTSNYPGASPQFSSANPKGNDFEITAEELAGIVFVPSAQRMQTVAHGGTVQGKKMNFKTVFFKGLLWGLIGGLVGWIISEVLGNATDAERILEWMGYYSLYSAPIESIISAVRLSTAFFSAFVACAIGLFMGMGEGIYYGSAEKAVKFAAVGAGISLTLGFVSGYIAQVLYKALSPDEYSIIINSFVRGIGWAIMGAGVGLAIGLIKPEGKRILFCMIGGLGGGFIGGFLFDFIFSFYSELFSMSENDDGVLPRAIGVLIMGLLVGLGIGLLEQAAKSAWLKVVRGEFEGKEYLVFSGTTSIGNSGKNTIVLFKDKLVGPNHCDIILEGSRYTLIDKGTPMGTVVNGMRIQRHVLKQGDAIAIGNSVLVFNTK